MNVSWGHCHRNHLGCHTNKNHHGGLVGNENDHHDGRPAGIWIESNGGVAVFENENDGVRSGNTRRKSRKRR